MTRLPAFPSCDDRATSDLDLAFHDPVVAGFRADVVSSFLELVTALGMQAQDVADVTGASVAEVRATFDGAGDISLGTIFEAFVALGHDVEVRVRPSTGPGHLTFVADRPLGPRVLPFRRRPDP